ncbi:hypothetical protein [Saccharopolyspora pogona]|uniref:hypothetical protein n=1 Tax=Saccharopolyspora pogona TaxID=333966 RepID=UPI001682B135|nr:hypothetical protein [Saccharopolyspora pogona]
MIAAVNAGGRDGHDVDLWDPQKGEEAEEADVLAATGVWVIPVLEVGPGREMVLPPDGSRLRSQDGGTGLPTEVTGPKRRGVSGAVAGGAGTKRMKRTREEADQSSSRASKRPTVAGTAGVDSGNQGGEGDGSAPTDQAAQQDHRSAEQKQRKKKTDAARYQARKDAAARAAARIADLKGREELAKKEADELAKLEPAVATWERNRNANAQYNRVRKADADDAIAKLKELKEQGRLTPEKQAELDLRQEIEIDVTEVNRLKVEVSRLKKRSSRWRRCRGVSRLRAGCVRCGTRWLSWRRR